MSNRYVLGVPEQQYRGGQRQSLDIELDGKLRERLREGFRVYLQTATSASGVDVGLLVAIAEQLLRGVVVNVYPDNFDVPVIPMVWDGSDKS